MHPTTILGASLVLAAGLGWLVFRGADAANAAATLPITPPEANGHYVLIVEGDRDGLQITKAVAKTDPWAGAPKGFTSDWTLTIRDAAGAVLAEVPLDVRQFDLRAERQNQPIEVEGCIVRDPHIAMLVNAPRYDAAASYAFARRAPAGAVALGTIDGDTVRKLAGGGR